MRRPGCCAQLRAALAAATAEDGEVSRGEREAQRRVGADGDGRTNSSAARRPAPRLQALQHQLAARRRRSAQHVTAHAHHTLRVRPDQGQNTCLYITLQTVITCLIHDLLLRETTKGKEVETDEMFATHTPSDLGKHRLVGVKTVGRLQSVGVCATLTTRFRFLLSHFTDLAGNHILEWCIIFVQFPLFLKPAPQIYVILPEFISRLAFYVVKRVPLPLPGA